jgi:hypothetical protein
MEIMEKMQIIIIKLIQVYQKKKKVNTPIKAKKIGNVNIIY